MSPLPGLGLPATWACHVSESSWRTPPLTYFRIIVTDAEGVSHCLDIVFKVNDNRYTFYLVVNILFVNTCLFIAYVRDNIFCFIEAPRSLTILGLIKNYLYHLTHCMFDTRSPLSRSPVHMKLKISISCHICNHHSPI